ncbi:MAG: chemotaxis protein [Alphaproteobacteria bacterium]|nr:chemotaxis protein [Alphaproteobacteria bacterium]
MSAAPSARRKEGSLVDGEYPLSAKNFAHIAKLLRDTSGIHLPDAKATLVYSRLAKRLRALGLRSFDDYCALVSSPEGAEERSAMLQALTTNVTRFYREPHHFDHLRDKIMPPLIARAKAGGRVRLWSSACSTGQEPYSMALTVLGAFPDAARYDVKMLATDIDAKVVDFARRGVYPDEAVTPIPAPLRERYLTRQKGEGEKSWRVNDDVRAFMSFNTLNLIGDWPMRGRFDVIFCRNVVIYFEQDTQNKIWTRFQNILTPEGRLYIGHSERVDIGGFANDGLTVYKLAAGVMR